MTLNNFQEIVEINRGKFVKKDKLYNQLKNIYVYGSVETKRQALDSKRCGITLLEKVAVDLSVEEQNTLWKEVYSLDRVFTVKDVREQIDIIELAREI